MKVELNLPPGQYVVVTRQELQRVMCEHGIVREIEGAVLNVPGAPTLWEPLHIASPGTGRPGDLEFNLAGQLVNADNDD